jgi:hypothetical protein
LVFFHFYFFISLVFISFHFLYFPFLSFPFLSFPFLSFPFLSFLYLTLPYQVEKKAAAAALKASGGAHTLINEVRTHPVFRRQQTLVRSATALRNFYLGYLSILSAQLSAHKPHGIICISTAAPQ